MHFIRITKLCLTFVLNGSNKERNGVALSFVVYSFFAYNDS